MECIESKISNRFVDVKSNTVEETTVATKYVILYTRGIMRGIKSGRTEQFLDGTCSSVVPVQ